MQGDFIDAVLPLGLETKSVSDPYVGSGTVMTEAMIRGLDFVGQDINPMAILLCQVKSESFNTIALREELDLVLMRAKAHQAPQDRPDFANIHKSNMSAPGTSRRPPSEDMPAARGG